MAERKHALVAGASGIIGNALVETLAAEPGWQVRALRRTDVPGVEAVDIDLTQAVTAIEGLREITHLFYAALSPRPELGEEERVNRAMLEHLLDGLRSAGAPLRHVVLYQGAKVYGVHLGAATAPFHEDDPRHIGPNFYYAQEDLLKERSGRDGYSWSILRPDVVVGHIAGNPMNIAMVIGAFAALSKAQGIPLRFPGSSITYRDVLAQVTDARWLARASLWAAEAGAARNQAFNLVGEPFRWERIWRDVAKEWGMETAEPQPLSLARHMPAHGAAWQALAQRHGLQPLPLERLVGWAFGDFVFHSEFDLVSDMGKIRRAGFVEPADNAAWFRDAFAALRRKRYLP